MAKAKVAISLDAALLQRVDALVKRHEYGSRSAAIELALRAQLLAKRDAAYEAMLGQLDRDDEVAMANQRYAGDVF